MIGKYKTEIKWAFIFIVVQLLWCFAERILGLHDEQLDKHEIVSMFFFIPAITVYVLAIRDKKNQYYKGQMNYTQGFLSGLLVTVIITLFTPLTQWIISEVISPDYFDNIIAFAVEGGYDTQENAEAFFNYQSYAIQSTIFAFVIGIITSLIVPIFVRTKAS